jgi:hypothetical protein
VLDFRAKHRGYSCHGFCLFVRNQEYIALWLRVTSYLTSKSNPVLCKWFLSELFPYHEFRNVSSQFPRRTLDLLRKSRCNNGYDFASFSLQPITKDSMSFRMRHVKTATIATKCVHLSTSFDYPIPKIAEQDTIVPPRVSAQRISFRANIPAARNAKNPCTKISCSRPRLPLGSYKI